MITKKGFLFTVSVILFATTLVFFTSAYSNINVKRETYIVNSYKSSIVPFMNDDIASDLKSISGIDADINVDGGKFYLLISDSIPKQANLDTNLNNYKSFLDNNYFAGVKGSAGLNLSNLNDGTIEILVGSSTYTNDYNNTKALFSSDFNSLDLNLEFFGKDLNTMIWTNNGSGVPINIHYRDDSNNFLLSPSINTSGLSTLKLVYNDGNVIINLGSSGGSYFMIDSNYSTILRYSLLISRNIDVNYLPVYFNSKLSYVAQGTDSNTLIKIAG